ncbi:unnamed protein product, partial [Closterium sp. Naga37s-1]
MEIITKTARLPPFSAWYDTKGCDPSTSSAADSDEGYNSSALATPPCDSNEPVNARGPPGVASSCFTAVNGSDARGLDDEERGRVENEKEAAKEESAEDAGESDDDGETRGGPEDRSEIILEEGPEEYHASDHDGGHENDDGGHENDDGGHENDDGGHENDDGGHENDDGGHENDDGGHENDDGGHENDDGGHENDDGGHESDDGRGYRESDDGGYEFGPEEEEAERAMLEEAEEASMQERFMAEKGVAEGAEGQNQRQQSWLTSVEWFVSWPLRRLSHPWRKRVLWVWVLVAAAILSLVFLAAWQHFASQLGSCGHTPPSSLLPPSQRVLWVWVLVAAAILSLVFFTAWQHAKTNEKHDLEEHCDEWAAFIGAKFNTTVANTRSISDFVRAYYLDKATYPTSFSPPIRLLCSLPPFTPHRTHPVTFATPSLRPISMKEDFRDLAKFQRFTQATLDIVAFTLLVNNSFMRDRIEKTAGHCFYGPGPNGTVSCRPRGLPLYAPVLVFNGRKDFNPRLRPIAAGCCYDMLEDPGVADMIHRAIDSASSVTSPPFMRDNYPYHFISQVFPVYVNLTTFALPPSPSPPSIAIPPLATPGPGVLPRGLVVAGYNFANLRSLVGFQQLVELKTRVYLVDGTRGGAWDGARNETARNEDGRTLRWMPALLFDHEGVVGEEEIGAWMVDGKEQERGRVRTMLMHAFECDCQHLAVAQHELRAARVEAEAASRAKGDFLTTVSHEIRTPMNGVIGMLNLLLETPLDGAQHDYAETACSSGRALCALINDILDLSKIEAEKLRLERIPLDLRAELDDVLALFVESADEKRSVEVAASVADDVPGMLLGDPLRVKQ